MQRDVKIGIAIGVLLIALIGIFWWARSNKAKTPPPTPTDTAAVLPVAPEPVAPPVATPGSGEVAIPGAPRPVAPTTIAGAPPATLAGGVAVLPPGAPTTTLPGAAVPPPVGQPPVAPAPAAERKYKVVQGDSLAKIAKQFYGDETKYKVIADANKIGAPYALKPGQELVIPEVAGAQPKPPPTPGATTKPAPAAGHTAVKEATKHKVVAGDTLSKLSKQYYGTEGKWKAIYEANKAKMKSENDLQVGMELVIPAEK
jgi:nucleoid-associated protein YgaU